MPSCSDYFDCVALVVAVDASDPTLRVLWFWDASDAVPLPLSSDSRASEEDSCRDPGALARLRELHQRLRPFCVPYQVDGGAALCWWTVK